MADIDQNLNKAAAYWDASAQSSGSHATIWLANPFVKGRINYLVTGSSELDPYQWFAKWLSLRGVEMPVSRMFSIGCGQGELERGMTQYNISEKITGCDISSVSVGIARSLAKANGFNNLDFIVTDLNIDPIIDESDLIMANMAVHHIENLDLLFSSAQLILNKSSAGGYFFMNEYIGPNRFQWTRKQIEIINRFIECLPEKRRILPNGTLKSSIRMPLNPEMIALDPSESVRSYEIMTVFEKYFEICEYRPYRGALLHMLISEISGNFSSDEDGIAFVKIFSEIEDILTEINILEDNFAVIIGKSKPF